jgi:tetraacyldisaccharide 4'-kinase
MLRNLRQKIETSWYQQTRWWNVLLLPFSWLFILISLLRRGYYRYVPQQKFNIPIIIVGNITVGGTGKTPLVIYLAHLLQQHGYRPGIISRGYGRKAKDCVLVTSKSNAAHVGDEPVLLAQRTQVPVMVARKRVVAAKKLLAEHDCNLIISDDGLQHYALPRDIEIAVLDGVRRLGNAWRLPAGPLRESAARLQNVDFVVTNGNANVGEYELTLKVDPLVNVRSREQQPFSTWHKQKIFAVAGIGNNQRFFDLLTAHGLHVIPCGYPDHHLYKITDFAELLAEPQIPIIMTEKDAVKCVAFATEQFWYLPVTAELPAEFNTTLLEKLEHL